VVDRLRISWPRILAEGTAIVVSILLAFWIQAWWEGRQEENRQSNYLASLRASLSIHRSNLAANMDYASTLRESARSLLKISIDPEYHVDDKELDTLLAALTWHLPDPLTPELAALLSNEDIGLITNRDVAYRLGALHAKLGRYERMVAYHQDFFFEELMPFLQREAFLPQINNYVSLLPGTQSEVYPIDKIDVLTPFSHSEMLGRRQFQNIIMRRIWRLSDVIDWSDDTEAGKDIYSDMDEILLLIDEELDR
jgi:hypothetical protein